MSKSKEEMYEYLTHLYRGGEHWDEYDDRREIEVLGNWVKQEAIAMAQWATSNDLTYLPSKDYWVNEEQEERNETFTNDQIYHLYLTTKKP